MCIYIPLNLLEKSLYLALTICREGVDRVNNLGHILFTVHFMLSVVAVGLFKINPLSITDSKKVNSFCGSSLDSTTLKYAPLKIH